MLTFESAFVFDLALLGPSLDQILAVVNLLQVDINYVNDDTRIVVVLVDH